MSLVLKHGAILMNGILHQKDLLIDQERIVKIGNNLSGDQEIDIKGKTVLPGLIDVHVHFREPGASHKEDFLTGSRAAAAGGVTTVFDMPNNNPPVLTQQDVDNKKLLAKKSLVNYGFYVGATAQTLATLNEVKEVVGIKVYLGSSTGNLLMNNIADLVKLLQMNNKLVVVHAEQEDLIKYFSELFKNTKKHHLMRDNLAALIATSSSMLAAQYYKKRLHIAHLSTKEEVDFLRKHKTEHISCEVCPHHLFYNLTFFDQHGNYGKMNPPLRSEDDRKALWEAIHDGIIDMIATDHAPHTREEKGLDFSDSPCGVPGVQTTLPLLLNEVYKGNLTLSDIARLCSENPARIFGVKDRGMVKEGFMADLVVVDLEKRGKILNEEQRSKCGWTPFHGMEITGWPVMTLVNGHIVFKDNQFFEEHKGRLIA